MASLPYDHVRKAGNQGDCVKHPALIAALDIALSGIGQEQIFRYLDLFTGQPCHPCLDGRVYEWTNGIGKFVVKSLPADAPAAVKSWWDLWRPASATASPSSYPGSSLLAMHMARRAGRRIALELFDVLPEVRRELDDYFRSVTQNDDDDSVSCTVGESLAANENNQERIVRADFALVDPPGWRTSENPNYPKWSDYRDYVLKPRIEQVRPTLLWMPAGGHGRTTSKKVSGKENSGAYPWDTKSRGGSFKMLDQSEKIGYSWTAVRWRKNSFSACILVYNLAKNEVRSAVECIVQTAGGDWEARHSE